MKTMKTEKNRMPSLLCAALLGAAVMFCIGAATGNGNRTVWEYRVVTGDVMNSEGSQALQPHLNQAADSGWEALSTAQAGEHWGFVVMRREKK